MQTLLALALAAAPVGGTGQMLPDTHAAITQPASGNALREVGDWGQQLIEAQQPMIDAFQQCSPIIQQIATAMRAGGRDAADSGLADEVYACIGRTKAAAAATEQRLRTLAPIPAAFARTMRVDPREILERAAQAAGNMVSFLGLVEQAIRHGLDGEEAKAEQTFRQATRYAASAIDAQILTLETMQAGMTLDTHKAMMDVRLNLNRATRALAVSEPGDPQLPATLRRLGADQRAAANNLRTHWQREQQSLQGALSRNPAGRAGLAAADRALMQIATVGDETAALLADLRDGEEEARLIEVDLAVTAGEVRILEAIRAMAASFSQAR